MIQIMLEQASKVVQNFAVAIILCYAWDESDHIRFHTPVVKTEHCGEKCLSTKRNACKQSKTTKFGVNTNGRIEYSFVLWWYLGHLIDKSMLYWRQILTDQRNYHILGYLTLRRRVS